jgi:hypothetical protein
LRHHQAGNAAHRGKKQALGEQLTDQPYAPSAKCGAQREFAATTNTARQQEIGHVHASDDQNK